jgi:hypothetical protein
MNENLIALMAAVGVLLTAIVLIGISARRTTLKLKNSLAETDEMRNTLLTLQAELAEARQTTPSVEKPTVRAFVPAPPLTADQRAGALEMLRNGADADAVSSAMGLSHPETALLQKVQKLLESTAQVAEKNMLPGRYVSAGSSLMTS